jgi:Domain of unknown function (DUF202)
VQVASQGTGGTADLPNATQLAVERTHLAYERTLMAWVRTATSLISFGFTIYKFFQWERNKNSDIVNAWGLRFVDPRRFIECIPADASCLATPLLHHRGRVHGKGQRCHLWKSLCTSLNSLFLLRFQYTLPLVSNNYRWGVEIPALHTVSNKPPHPLK